MKTEDPARLLHAASLPFPAFLPDPCGPVRRFAWLAGLALVVVALAPDASAEQKIDEPAEAKHFTLNVLPLLKEKCLGCHGNDADDIKGDFDVRTRESLIKGGESEEPSIIPGKPDESPFYMAVMWDGMEMPPKENDRLTEEQTEWVRRWIAVGAPWPDEQVQDEIRKAEWSVEENEDGVLISTSGGIG